MAEKKGEGPAVLAAVPVVAVHPEFGRRFREDRRLSHFEGADGALLARVQEAFLNGARRRPGKYDGSLIVEISPQGVYCCVSQHARLRDGFSKPEAGHAEAVLHHRNLVRQFEETAGRKVRRAPADSAAEYFVVAVHGWRGESKPSQPRLAV